MDMTGFELIKATKQQVWEALNDAEVLKACIPGCEELIKTSDVEFTAKTVLKIGPVKAKFSGVVRLEDLDPPNGYRLVGEGSGGIAGHAKGGATVTLTEEEEGVRLAYEVKSEIGGKIAQLGSRLIDATAKRLAGEFFGKFKETLEQTSNA
jgi:uncharacterized protein